VTTFSRFPFLLGRFQFGLEPFDCQTKADAANREIDQDGARQVGEITDVWGRGVKRCNSPSLVNP